MKFKQFCEAKDCGNFRWVKSEEEARKIMAKHKKFYCKNINVKLNVMNQYIE
jgi:hypothetical protein